MNYTKTKTEIKKNVFMENELRKAARPAIEKALKLLRPYIGQKIVKAGGEAFIKKLHDALNASPEFDMDKVQINPYKAPGVKTADNYARLHYISIQPLHRSLWLKLSICFTGGDYTNKTYYCEYVEDSFYLGDIISPIFPGQENTPGLLTALVKAPTLPAIDQAAEYENYTQAIAALERFEGFNGKLLSRNRLKK
jgi:hypothetical protein